LFFALEYVYFGSFNSLLSFQVRKFLSKIEEGRNLKSMEVWQEESTLKIKGGNSKIKRRRSRENSSRKT
jgi:hypothetical protein